MKTRQACHGNALKFAGFLLLSALMVSVYAVRAAAQDEGWQIIKADYGYGVQRVDVTRIVLDLMARGGVNGRVAINNETMGGDPAVGRDKTLRIFAKNRHNQQQEFHVNEGDSFPARNFMLPDAHSAPPPAGSRMQNSFQGDRGDHAEDFDHGDHPEHFDHGDENRAEHDHDRMRRLIIVKAFYGVQGRSVNVTDRVQSMLEDGRLTMPVNNASLGGDPAVGADKMLIVVYAIDGQEQATAVREGFILSLP